jgi:hypothetical protein
VPPCGASAADPGAAPPWSWAIVATTTTSTAVLSGIWA